MLITGWDEEKYLLAFDNVVPNRRTPKIDVKVRVRTSCAHEKVLDDIRNMKLKERTKKMIRAAGTIPSNPN